MIDTDTHVERAGHLLFSEALAQYLTARDTLAHNRAGWKLAESEMAEAAAQMDYLVNTAPSERD